MHFAFNEEQELIRSSVRKHLEDRLPLSALRALLDSDAEATFDRSTWSEGAQLGWFAMLAPEDVGGGSITDQPLVDLAGISEELGRQLYPGPVLETNVAIDMLVQHGSAEQRELASQLVAGEVIATLCSGTDGRLGGAAVGVRMSADPGAGTATLDGRACFVRAAASSDVLLTVVTGAAGPAVVVVPAASAGIEWRRLASIDITRRYYEVTFEGVVVRDTSVLVSGPDCDTALARAARLATVVQAAEAVGAAGELFTRTVEYLKIREQFGRTIASYQVIKHKLADLFIDLEAAQAAARYAAMAISDERPDSDEAVAIAGAYVKEAFANLCSQSLQLHGGIGFTWEHDLHLFLRRAKADQRLLGSLDDHLDQLFSIIDARATA
jgi:alkylation response protein AidB-like acyl-CoA dehydrogenase